MPPTITSHVLCELIIIFRDSIPHLHWEIAIFETLREMNEARPFKLVFSFAAGFEEMVSSVFSIRRPPSVERDFAEDGT